MITPIQATFSGFMNKAASIYSVYDDERLILAVSLMGEFTRERREGCVLITNDSTLEDYDVLFGEDKFQDSIGSYFSLLNGMAADAASKKLVISEKAMRSDPQIALEADGMNESGPKYRISPDITSAQIAVLATCWYAATKGGLFETTINYFNDVKMPDFMVRLDQGEVVTF
jgi:hypothetical protein